MMIKDKRFTLQEICENITMKLCLICNRGLVGNWHIPLCEKHRKDYLDEIEDLEDD